MAKKKKYLAMDLKEVATVVTDVIGYRYREMERAFGNIQEPMMRAFKVGTEPMATDMVSFMLQHHRSGDTLSSFTTGTVLYNPTTDAYEFKLGFDFEKGGFPALILERGDNGSPMRMPNKSYWFIHWANKNNIEGVFDAMQTELSKMLKEVER